MSPVGSKIVFGVWHAAREGVTFPMKAERNCKGHKYTHSGRRWTGQVGQVGHGEGKQRRTLRSVVAGGGGDYVAEAGVWW